MQLPTNPAHSENHFAKMLHTQRELAALLVEEEKMYLEIVMKKDPNISTHEGLVDLAAELVVQ